MSRVEPYVLGLIPARSGSKGVLHKNLRKLNGKSLLEWSIAASIQTPQITRTIVSTNSKEYAKIAEFSGADVPFLRPETISQDHSTDLEFVMHTLQFLELEGAIPDIIIHLRPTTPFRNPSVVTEAISLGLSIESDITAVRSVHEMEESAYKTFEISANGKLISTFTQNQNLDQANQARQVFPKTYSPNGYVDILYPKYILDCGQLHGDTVLPFFTQKMLEIDHESDMNLAKAILSANPELFGVLFGDK